MLSWIQKFFLIPVCPEFPGTSGPKSFPLMSDDNFDVEILTIPFFWEGQTRFGSYPVHVRYHTLHYNYWLLSLDHFGRSLLKRPSRRGTPTRWLHPDFLLGMLSSPPISRAAFDRTFLHDRHGLEYEVYRNCVSRYQGHTFLSTLRRFEKQYNKQSVVWGAFDGRPATIDKIYRLYHIDWKAFDNLVRLRRSGRIR